MIINFLQHNDKFDVEDIRFANWWTQYLKDYLIRNGSGHRLDDVVLYACPLLSQAGTPVGFVAEESLDIKRKYSIMIEVNRIKERFVMLFVPETPYNDTALEVDLVNFKRIHTLLQMYIFR